MTLLEQKIIALSREIRDTKSPKRRRDLERALMRARTQLSRRIRKEGGV